MNFKYPLLLVCVSSCTVFNLFAKETLEPWQQAQKTEVWEPIPAVVSAPVNQPPSDAIVLFDGSSTDHWEASNKQPFEWTIADQVLTVKPGSGDIQTKQRFCDVQLHLEWMTPLPVDGMKGQDRNNSGVFLQQRYEIQILDSFDNQTYPNGQAASVYKQSIPSVNAMRPPGQWQTYDIIYQAPKFNQGELEQPAFVTVIHNGVVVQNHTEIQGKTEWIGEPSYQAHGCEPIRLQDHGNLVSFRNIWVRDLSTLD